MKYLTARQCEWLAAIARFTAEHGYPPTERELRDLMGVGSTNGVRDMVTSLVRKGHLVFATPGVIVTRGVHLAKRTMPLAVKTKAGEKMFRVPGDWEQVEKG